jgi:hypothetical protein
MMFVLKSLNIAGVIKPAVLFGNELAFDADN